MKSKLTLKLPDTSDAEKWLDEDTFVFESQIYKVKANGIIELLASNNKRREK